MTKHDIQGGHVGGRRLSTSAFFLVSGGVLLLVSLPLITTLICGDAPVNVPLWVWAGYSSFFLGWVLIGAGLAGSGRRVRGVALAGVVYLVIGVILAALLGGPAVVEGDGWAVFLRTLIEWPWLLEAALGLLDECIN